MNLQTERNSFTPSSAGKIIGALFLIQMVVGIYINFALLPTLSWEPGALAAEAPSGIKFGLITLLALINSSFNLVVGIIGYLIFKNHNPFLALMVLIFPAVSLALTGVEYTHFLELVFYSQNYQAASADAKVLFETLRPVFAASRDWAHYIAIGFSGFSLFLFYSLLLRSASMPRLLAGFGMLAAASQVCGVSFGLLGNSIPMVMLMPLALAQLILPLYLFIKGLSVRDDLLA